MKLKLMQHARRLGWKEKLYDFNAYTSISQRFLTNCLPLYPQLLNLASYKQRQSVFLKETNLTTTPFIYPSVPAGKEGTAQGAAHKLKWERCQQSRLHLPVG